MRFGAFAIQGIVLLASSIWSSPQHLITIKDSTIRYSPGFLFSKEAENRAIHLREKLGFGGESELEEIGPRLLRGKIPIPPASYADQSEQDRVHALILNDIGFSGYREGGLLDSKMLSLPTHHHLHRISRSYAGVPVYSSEFVVVTDGDNLTEFYGSPIVSPANTQFFHTESDIRSIVAAKLASRRILSVEKVLFNAVLLDQQKPNTTIQAWKIEFDDGPYSTLGELILGDSSESVLYSRSYARDALNRKVGNGFDPYQVSSSWARVEGGPTSSVPLVNNEYGWMGDWYNFFQKYNRDGADDLGTPMWGFVNVSPTIKYSECDAQGICTDYYNNCSTSPNALTGQGTDGDGNKIFVARFCPDIAVQTISLHEWTHTLTRSTANFPASPNYSSGLDEGFADAFSGLISQNWILGDGLPTALLNLRRFPSNPSSDGSSINSYTQYDTSIDGHALAGLISHPAWLLTNGGAGSGTDVVLGRGYSITSDLYYATLVRLTENTTIPQFAQMLVAQAKAGFSYGPRSTACDALMAVRSVGLDAGIATDVCTDKVKNVAVLYTTN